MPNFPTLMRAPLPTFLIIDLYSRSSTLGEMWTDMLLGNNKYRLDTHEEDSAKGEANIS